MKQCERDMANHSLVLTAYIRKTAHTTSHITGQRNSCDKY